MPHTYHALAFSPAVKALQERLGSRQSYARLEAGEERNRRLGPREAAFIAARDSFYIATVGETGWPYVQHRGGPKGFLRVIDERTLGFADFAGNRQYITAGNLQANDRVSLILVDYAGRQRLKILGRAREIASDEDELLSRLAPEGHDVRIERGLVIEVAGFDWNCPQHITPRYTADEVADAVAPLHARIAELEAVVARDAGARKCTVDGTGGALQRGPALEHRRGRHS